MGLRIGTNMGNYADEARARATEEEEEEDEEDEEEEEEEIFPT